MCICLHECASAVVVGAPMPMPIPIDMSVPMLAYFIKREKDYRAAFGERTETRLSGGAFVGASPHTPLHRGRVRHRMGG